MPNDHSHSVAGKFSTRPAELTTHCRKHQPDSIAFHPILKGSTHINLSKSLDNLRKRLLDALFRRDITPNGKYLQLSLGKFSGLLYGGEQMENK